MSILTFQILKEIILNRDLIKKGNRAGYFSINRDSGTIIYEADDKPRDFKGKEVVRAFFVVKLVEKYGYPDNAIQLDVEIAGLGSADLVVSKNNRPFIVVECETEEILEKEIKQARIELESKTRALAAPYGALIIGRREMIFDLKQEPKRILELPFGDEA